MFDRITDEFKKVTSVVVAAALAFSLTTTSAFAAENEDAENKTQSQEIDIKNLRDGKYEVGIEMIKPDSTSKIDTDACGRSMANGAIEHKALVVVENGEAKIHMNFGYLDLFGKRGYLGSFYVHPKAFPGYGDKDVWNKYKTKYEITKTLEYVLDEKGNKYIDEFNDPNGEIAQKWPKCRVDYAKTIEFPLHDYMLGDGNNGFASAQVLVPVMESLGGFGTQEVLIRIAWKGGWTEAKNSESDKLERLDFEAIKPTQKTIEKWKAEDKEILEQAKVDAKAQLQASEKWAYMAPYAAEASLNYHGMVLEWIDGKENLEDLKTFVKNAKVKTDALYDKQKAEEAKIKTEVEALKNSDEYREQEKAELDQLVDSFLTGADTCENAKVFFDLHNALKKDIAQLKTKSQYEAEEAALQNAKDKASEAIQKLEAKAIDEQGNAIYREAEKAEFDGVIATAKEEVEKAETPEAVSQALKKAEQAIPSIKTDAQYKLEEAKTLEEAIENACAILDGIDSSVYREEEKAQCDAIVAKAKEDIQKVKSVDEINSLLVAAQDKIDALKTDKQYKVEELEEAKNDAGAILDGIDSTIYREEEKAQFDAIVAKAKEDIQNAESIDEIDPLVKAAQEKINALKTDKQYKVEELEEAKNNASAILDGVDSTIYREEEKAELNKIVAKAKENIQNAETIDEIDPLIKAAQKEINALKTDAEYKAEEAKNNACAILDGINSNIYREQEKAELNKIVAKAKEDIQNTTSVDEIDPLVKAAQEKIDALKTDKQYKVDEFFNSVKDFIDSNTGLIDTIKDFIANLIANNSAEKLDFANLEDGNYTVYGEMVKSHDKAKNSMSDGAIDHNIKLDVKDGTYTITMTFKGMEIGDKLGYLGKLKYQDAEGNLQDVKVIKSIEHDGVSYPEVISFPMIESTKADGYVPLQVFVKTMEDITAGLGTQDVLLKLDPKTIVKGDQVIAEPSEGNQGEGGSAAGKGDSGNLSKPGAGLPKPGAGLGKPGAGLAKPSAGLAGKKLAKTGDNLAVGALALTVLAGAGVVTYVVARKKVFKK